MHMHMRNESLLHIIMCFIMFNYAVAHHAQTKAMLSVVLGGRYVIRQKDVCW